VKIYKITLVGCDDMTEMFYPLNDEQAELIKNICELSKEKSDYSCMPTMKIEEENK
jgi:hypothetical protein